MRSVEHQHHEVESGLGPAAHWNGFDGDVTHSAAVVVFPAAADGHEAFLGLEDGFACLEHQVGPDHFHQVEARLTRAGLEERAHIALEVKNLQI